MMKTCTGCGTTKPLEDFYRRTASKDGRQSVCKLCTKVYWQGWYAKNGDSVRARSLAQAQADPQKNRDRANAWNNANPERHYERSREAKHRRRVLEKGTAAGPINYAMLSSDCGLCGDPIDVELRHPHPMSRSLDHIIPISKGGTHTQDNVQWAHLGCNLSKYVSVPEGVSHA